MKEQELAAALRRNGGFLSGPPVDDGFLEGWAVHPFTGFAKGHWWRAKRKDVAAPIVAGLFSACGLWTVATREVPLLQLGNMPPCGNCDRIMLSKGKILTLPQEF